ncbi:malonyl-CoA decarboxylase, mitochondrial-like isoform X2 [Oratosquilla oratoria]
MRDMCYYYNQLSIGEKSEFLLHLAKNLGTNHDQVKELAQSIPRANEGDPDEATAILRWEDRLRQALQPSFHWVTMQISRLSGGVKFLVDLREHILVTLYGLSSDSENQAALKTLDVTLRELLSLWFTVGLLSLQRITWESSCDMLQKVSEYEAVHPVRNWTDLKRRVGNYRRCFVFTHSCMPSEPLVVLHTFLTNEISRSMNKIVQNPRYSSEEENSMAAGEDPSTITTAIFYSITSTQKGLQGIELGHYLIKRVVRELQAELPKISQFSSLSPIPGYTKWLIGSLVKAQRGEIKLFTDCEVEDLQKLFSVHSEYEVYEKLRKSLGNNGWSDDESLVKALEEPLMRLCSHYLYNEKRRGFAFDSVANFHLKNGAVMWRINWKADWSPRGLGNSCGIMVNYRYFLEDCDTNTKKYLENAKINASDPVVLLARKGGEIIRGSTSTSPSSPPPPVITITPDSKM